MNNFFEVDPHPGNPKVLFIGLGASTHTHSWIDLLSGTQLNVRLFSVPGGGLPPPAWHVPTYICDRILPAEDDPNTRQFFYPLPEELNRRELALQEFQRNRVFQFFHYLQTKINTLAERWGQPQLVFDYSRYRDPRVPNPAAPKAASPEEWLARIIQDWQPDIIHTLGLFDGQGGTFYFDVRQQFGLQGIGKWVLQLRGGSDLALNHSIPEMAARIREMTSECTQIICDNLQNIEYLRKLDLRDDQISPLIPVPGTGGIDIAQLSSLRTATASESRDIVFPKGYELKWSKCLPVFEAFQLCWERIAPCRIHILNVTPEIREWFYTLPSHIQECCILYERIPRRDFFSLLAAARVLLIPSLVDGVPNSLYEAMAIGTFPIVSPLDTIRSVVAAEKNVLFARNLYPHEIAEALTRAMTDDVMVDVAVKNNLELVARVAERSVIRKRLTEYYQSLAIPVWKDGENELPLVTVITPAYNRASFLDETIQSVLSQDYPNIEYIVLDDGSKDNTLEVLEKYRDRIIIESHANMGETRTVNKGFQMARGEIVCVVNSDDPLLKNAIRVGVMALQSNPDALAAYPDWNEIDPESTPIRQLLLPDYDIEMMLRSFNVGMGPGVFIRRSAIERFGMRDPQFKYVGDLEFWFRLALHGKLVHIPNIVATHRVHPGAASVTDQGARMADELIRMLHKLYSSENVPLPIQRIRRKVLSNAHFVATFYCGQDRKAKSRHLFWHYWYDPLPAIYRFLRSGFARINIFFKFYLYVHGILAKVKRRVKVLLSR